MNGQLISILATLKATAFAGLFIAISPVTDSTTGLGLVRSFLAPMFG